MAAQKAQVKKTKKPKASPVQRSVLRRFVVLWPLWFILSAVMLAAYVAFLDYKVRLHFAGAQWALPAHVYARPLELYASAALSPSELEEKLRQLGYRAKRQPSRPGEYRRLPQSLDIVSRPFQFWDGLQVSRNVRISFAQRHVSSLRALDRLGELSWFRLQPERIASIYPAHHEDRLLVKYADLPSHLIEALLVVEDGNFFQHHGVRPQAIARALLANIQAGERVQGGSTLTQQLVKNLFLSNERTLSRKANEVIMALLLEWRFSKEQILEAYFNEVYFGQSGARAIHGFALASEFYFRRPLIELDLDQMALLVGLVKGASYYNPYRHPERAKKRRNLVLRLMHTAKLISKKVYFQAKAAPLGLAPARLPRASQYPAYLELVKRQLYRDYDERDLRSAGLSIFTYMDSHLQQQAESAVTSGIKALADQKRYPDRQTALISVDRSSGEVLAVIGGRDPKKGDFNRVLDAQRPIGSLVKPALYLAALSQPWRYQLSSLLSDQALSLETQEGLWQPQNYDHKSHGKVPLYRALAHSYNLASVRLGMELGLPKVVRQLHELGIKKDIKAYPSLLLGALELSPFEVADFYQTLANNGFHAPLRSIHAVLTAKGEPLRRYPLKVSAGADPTAVYLTQFALQKVTQEGSARSLQWRLPKIILAGKTGTSNDLRDSWFAGYGDRLLTVVWVGNDDNSPMGLSGSSGALPLWAKFMSLADVKSLVSTVPAGVEWRWVNAKGQQSREDCPEAKKLPFDRRSAALKTSFCYQVDDEPDNWLEDLS
ncbi:MAG: penicillin-binding protein 1B [Gammaproteobacteria bacterium]|nr:penicillin-binding protein 1B [Gammaproteobacteria bacterium]